MIVLVLHCMGYPLSRTKYLQTSQTMQSVVDHFRSIASPLLNPPLKGKLANERKEIHRLKIKENWCGTSVFRSRRSSLLTYGHTKRCRYVTSIPLSDLMFVCKASKPGRWIIGMFDQAASRTFSLCCRVFFNHRLRIQTSWRPSIAFKEGSP